MIVFPTDGRQFYGLVNVSSGLNGFRPPGMLPISSPAANSSSPLRYWYPRTRANHLFFYCRKKRKKQLKCRGTKLLFCMESLECVRRRKYILSRSSIVLKIFPGGLFLLKKNYFYGNFNLEPRRHPRHAPRVRISMLGWRI